MRLNARFNLVLEKRESHEDVLRALSQFIDVLMIRNDDHNILIRDLSAL